MTHNFSVLFYVKHNMLSTKVAHQGVKFRRATARIKIYQIPHEIFGTESQFFLSFTSLFSVVSLLYFFN